MLINPITYWFVFSEHSFLLIKKEDGSYDIPSGDNPPVAIERKIEVIKTPEAVWYTGHSLSPLIETKEYLPIDLRASWDIIDPDLHQLAGKASQLLHWDKHSHFCPACGTPTQPSSLPVMKLCPACHYELYPVISTAILALVRKEDKILLVQARNFRGNFRSLVAGFLETGESLEECVSREVKEETGLDIKNITYFGNQTWPYPSGLMVGFIADYAGGEINLQDEELTEGEFYSRENLPELPRRLSLARKMIDWWLKNPVSVSTSPTEGEASSSL